MKNPLFDVSSWLHIAGIAHSRLRKFSHRSSHLPSRNGAVLCGVLQKLFKMSSVFYSTRLQFSSQLYSIKYFIIIVLSIYCMCGGTGQTFLRLVSYYFSICFFFFRYRCICKTLKKYGLSPTKRTIFNEKSNIPVECNQNLEKLKKKSANYWLEF